MFSKGKSLLLAGLLSVCFCGCSRVWFENRAVQRARTYLLENSPELTAEQRAFVRYNVPVLLEEQIFGPKGSGASDLSQICVTWVIPGCADAYLVFGASDTRMMSWYPNRLIRKRFSNPEKALFTASALARTYALNSLYFELTAHEYNCVRFELPELFRTSFDLPLDPEGNLKPDEVEERRRMLQFSLVWSPRDQTEKIVISGVGNPDLSGLTILGGGRMSPEYLKLHTLQVKQVFSRGGAETQSPLPVQVDAPGSIGE